MLHGDGVCKWLFHSFGSLTVTHTSTILNLKFTKSQEVGWGEEESWSKGGICGKDQPCYQYDQLLWKTVTLKTSYS